MEVNNDFTEGIALIKRGFGKLSAGPIDFYLRTLIEHSEALLTKFTPIKEGERAVIIERPPCDGGWAGCERTLRVGATGTIIKVEYWDDQFILKFVPDEEWHYNKLDETWRKVAQPHSYALSARYLKRLDDVQDPAN